MKRCYQFLLAVLLAGLGRATIPVQAAEPARPNVVMIVADDLGWNDVGYHGSEIRTPNLDALAAGGVKLDHYYVWPVCSPTRTALLTSRNPSRFDILSAIGGRSEQALPTGTPTLADVLKAQGYATAITGKWHLGLRPAVGPRQYGFDYTYGYLHGQVDPYTHMYKIGDPTWHENDQFRQEEGHATDLIAAAAVRWIETRTSRQSQSPFFLYVAFSVPHTPLNEDAQWVKPYEEAGPDRIADPSRRLFAASVTHMDAAIGRIVAALDKSGRRAQTLLILTSDNGGQRNQPASDEYEGRYPAFPVLGNNKPLRGWKGDVYEGGIRVAGFANWPGTLAPRTVEAVTCGLDWLPTIAALAGAPARPEARWEGTDIGPLLTGAATTASPRGLYWKTPRESALREGDWKLIEARRPGTAAAQLFNVAADPLEKNDRAAEEPQRVAHLRQLLKEQQALDPR
jgi:arylsulfatase A-like enzyme